MRPAKELFPLKELAWVIGKHLEAGLSSVFLPASAIDG
jgi:hypothetical protein